MAGANPQERVIETFEPFSGFKFFPGTGINLFADAADIEGLFGVGKGFRHHADARDVIIPARMLAKRRQRQLRGHEFFRRSHARLYFVEQVAHGRSPPF